MPPKMNVYIKLLPRIFSAHSLSRLPKTIDILAAEPAPISEPKAWIIFITGMVMASPAMANGPIPLPMNILSAIL